jgi:hypothetical protein
METASMCSRRPYSSSKIVCETKTAREDGDEKTDDERHRESLDRSGAELEEEDRRDDDRDVRVDDGGEGLGEPVLDGGLRSPARPELFRMRSKISTFESTAMPIVRMNPAMPGSVSVAPKSDIAPREAGAFKRSARTRSSPARR